MERTAPKALRMDRVFVGRLLRVGTLSALLSAGANAIVLAVASSLLGAVVIPPGETVTLGQVVGASVVGSIGAAVIFAVIGRFTRRPVRIFWGIAAVGLLTKLGRKEQGVLWGDQGSGEEVGNRLAPLKGALTTIRHGELEDEEGNYG